MCGIAGIIGEKASKRLIRQLLLPIAHRGEASYRNEILTLPGMAIGTNRLAIVDENSGRQPVQVEREKIYCVFNGEIYNHVELRHQLVVDRHFLSECDSEVVLHAYLKWGDEFVYYLDGKYSIAIFDEMKNVLTLVRDPMGVKPLFYTKVNGNWIFASELKSFLTLKDSLVEVIELKPGTIWKNGIVKSYFNLPQFSRQKKYGISMQDYSLKLKECLIRAVKKRIPKESTKIACLLSGGIDSSIITYLTKQLHQNVVAYTLAALNMHSADLVAAKALCQQFNIKHIIVSPPVQEMQQFYLDHGVYMTESFEPVLVRNAVSYHFLCRRVVEDGFKYCLNGEGADELFGGYDFVQEVPKHLQEDAIWHSLSIIHKTYLQMADRASMYATLEARVPYMDRDLVNFCVSLPPNARINEGKNKILLRQIFENELPENIVNRKKTGMNEGAGFGMNASNESIYYQAVQSYYEQNNSKFDEDIILCQKVAIEGSIDLTDMEEVYNFARFIRFNYMKLRDSQNRLQLNTKLKKIFMKSLSDVELEK